MPQSDPISGMNVKLPCPPPLVFPSPPVEAAVLADLVRQERAGRQRDRPEQRLGGFLETINLDLPVEAPNDAFRKLTRPKDP